MSRQHKHDRLSAQPQHNQPYTPLRRNHRRKSTPKMGRSRNLEKTFADEDLFALCMKSSTRVGERPRQGLHLRPLVGAVPEVEHVAAFNDALVQFRRHNAPANNGVAGIAALGDLPPSQGAGDFQWIWSCKQVFVQLGLKQIS